MSFRLNDYIGNKEEEAYVARVKYSQYALQQVRNIEKYGISDTAKSRKYVEGITIDGETSLDLDDAIWAEKGENGYQVSIHISDPTEAIPKYSPLDLEALKRTTSIYRTNGILNMYPEILSNNIFSLNKNNKKLTLTITIDLDFDTNIKHFSITESIFQNKKQHNYETFMDDFINPDALFHDTYQLMYEIARKRRQQRREKGATLDYDETDRRLYLGKKEEKIIQNFKKIPHQIVEEWAILGNICAASYMVKKNISQILRAHLDINEKAFYTQKDEGHKALALNNYTHFTSPIRRYSDGMVHRIIKSYLNDRNNVYENEEINQIIEYINKKTLAIGMLGKYYDIEIWGEEKVNMLKEAYGDDLKVHHLKLYIRNSINNNKGIPKVMIKEIKKDIENGSIGDWGWSIGLFLTSEEKEVKELLYKKLLEENIMERKKIISILNHTKMMRGDSTPIFQIEEKNENNKISLQFSFQGKKLFQYTESYQNEYEERYAKQVLYLKTIKGIFDIFM